MDDQSQGFMIFIGLCFVKSCVLLLNNFFDSFKFLESVMVCEIGLDVLERSMSL